MSTVVETGQSSSWREGAQNVRWNVRPFIDGTYRDSASSDVFEDVTPATEEALCEVAVGHPADVDAAVGAARARFEDGSWSGLPPGRRGEILFRLADLIAEHKEELALLDCLEMGKPIQAALFDAEVFATGLLRAWAGYADKLTGETLPLTPGTLALNVWEPRGVVGAITPWNFPIVNAVFKVGPALAAGNTMVLKPSELSPSSALRLAELALEAGLPAGVLNVVPGLGETVGEALALHPDVDFLSFTGSTATGRRIMELSGRSNGKPVALECGGKSPQVVFADAANLDAVADATLQTLLWNTGQVCSAQTRLVVEEEVKDALVEKLIERLRPHEPGDPLDEATTFGPLASPGQRDRVKAYVDQGLAAGAEPVLHGRIQEQGGCYVAPTVFDRVDDSMSIVQEEIFGPVLCVQSFATEAEAITLANGTGYGLAAGLWTRDLGRAKRMMHALRSGAVFAHTSGEEEPPSIFNLSYEPRKASGFGSELGLRGLESYSTLKVLYVSGS
jgi:acyl-CoA reductase-like NAD-dependent aldehyde dehydrogenase